MYFIIYTEDSPENGHKRGEFLAEHREWLKSDHDGVTLHVAGPWTDDKGVSKGSFLIIEAISEARAKSWVAEDPFVREAIPGLTIFRPYNWIVGKPA